MLSIIPPEITIGSFSIVGILTGYIWNTQAKSISELKKRQNNLPCQLIHNQMTEMKTDLKWIKQNLINLKK